MTFLDQTYLHSKSPTSEAMASGPLSLMVSAASLRPANNPGASISYMALRAGINANQLRKWGGKSARSPVSVFVPVTSIDNSIYSAPIAVASVYPEMANPSRPAVEPTHLMAQLSNGVTIRLECGEHDAGLVSAMIQALGAI
ncbi:hypothetical protein ACIQVE_01885 [Pseudomonas sp. NPDC098747]|uniref:hypothetical protein n=1 Tax=Pseudomonas sp. NPDC098747 TaxID=3364487 RepID=UPI00383AC140